MRPETRHYLEKVEAAINRAVGVSIFQWTMPLSAVAREKITTGFTLIAWVDSLESAQRVYTDHIRIHL